MKEKFKMTKTLYPGDQVFLNNMDTVYTFLGFGFKGILQFSNPFKHTKIHILQNQKDLALFFNTANNDIHFIALNKMPTSFLLYEYFKKPLSTNDVYSILDKFQNDHLECFVLSRDKLNKISLSVENFFNPLERLQNPDILKKYFGFIINDTTTGMKTFVQSKDVYSVIFNKFFHLINTYPIKEITGNEILFEHSDKNFCCHDFSNILNDLHTGIQQIYSIKLFVPE